MAVRSDRAEEWADAQERPEDYESVYWLHEDIARVGEGLDADESAVLRGTLENVVDDADLLGISHPETQGLVTAAQKLPGPALPEHGRALTREATEDQREQVLRLYLAVCVKVLRVMNDDEA